MDGYFWPTIFNEMIPMKKMNPVVHFEMPADDKKRMADFYSNVFGWQTQMMGKEMGNYVVVSTTETDKNGRPINPGAINGGFYEKQSAKPPHVPSVVIAVDNIEDHMRRIADAGGKVIDQPVDIPGIGKYVSFTDTEGNRVSILQPLPM